MMVRHHHGHFLFHRKGNLGSRRNAVVAGDNGLDPGFIRILYEPVI